KGQVFENLENFLSHFVGYLLRLLRTLGSQLACQHQDVCQHAVMQFTCDVCLNFFLLIQKFVNNILLRKNQILHQILVRLAVESESILKAMSFVYTCEIVDMLEVVSGFLLNGVHSRQQDQIAKEGFE